MMFLAGMCFGAVLGFLACALMSANKAPACIDCAGLIERDQTIAAQEADISALCEDKRVLQQSCASLRDAYKRAVSQTQSIAFLAQKEA